MPHSQQFVTVFLWSFGHDILYVSTLWHAVVSTRHVAVEIHCSIGAKFCQKERYEQVDTCVREKASACLVPKVQVKVLL